MPSRPGPRHETPVAIVAVDEILLADLEEHARVAQRAAAAVAGGHGDVVRLDRLRRREFEGYGLVSHAAI